MSIAAVGPATGETELTSDTITVIHPSSGSPVAGDTLQVTIAHTDVGDIVFATDLLANGWTLDVTKGEVGGSSDYPYIVVASRTLTEDDLDAEDWTFTASEVLDSIRATLVVLRCDQHEATELVDLPALDLAITNLVGAGEGEAMEDLLLDPVTGDIKFTTDVHVVSGPAAVGQAIDLRLSLVLGEWWLDPTLGVDWFGEILVKAPNLARIETELRTVVEETLGVDKVLAFSVALDRATRILSASYTVSTALGEFSATFTSAALEAA